MSKTLIVYGEGGHAAQMVRLISCVGIDESKCVSLVDSKQLNHFSNVNIVKPLRKKHGTNLMYFMYSFFYNLKVLVTIFRNNNIDSILSTGPGLCILPALYGRVKGIPVVFVETWSRFETKSITGRVMYHLATHFYVQNEELLSVYPNSLYAGRL